jgi:hypothetical protein
VWDDIRVMMRSAVGVGDVSIAVDGGRLEGFDCDDELLAEVMEKVGNVDEVNEGEEDVCKASGL